MEELDLDTEWVSELAACEAAYDDFYEEQQRVIDCYVLAVDSHNTLSHISKTKIDVHLGVVTVESISAVFSKARLPAQRLEEVVLFKIASSPEDILSLSLSDDVTLHAPGCDVVVGESPKGLHCVNAIFLLGRERDRADGTRRVRVTFARKTRRKH